MEIQVKRTDDQREYWEDSISYLEGVCDVAIGLTQHPNCEHGGLYWIVAEAVKKIENIYAVRTESADREGFVLVCISQEELRSFERDIAFVKGFLQTARRISIADEAFKGLDVIAAEGEEKLDKFITPFYYDEDTKASTEKDKNQKTVEEGMGD